MSRDFVVTQADETVGSVNGEIFIKAVRRAHAHVPGEVGETVVRGKLVATIGGKIIPRVIEGQAQTGADIGRKGTVVVEVPEQVGKERGVVPGALDVAHIDAAVAPGLFAVAAHGEFNFRAQGQHLLRPEVIPQGQRAAQGKLAVVVHARTGQSGRTFHPASVLNAHQELGSQVHAGAFRRGQTGQGKRQHKRQSGNNTFHDSPPECFSPSARREF